jgi:DNA-binding IclR family transcriptional regulator
LDPVSQTSAPDPATPLPHNGDRATAPERAYTALQGIGRAMSVLETLARRPLRAKDLAEQLGLKWTTAHRTLTFFEEQGYLHRDDASGEYSIGARAYALGSAYLVQHRFAHAAGSPLRTAADRHQCGAQANERYGTTVITVAAVDPPTSIPKTSAGFTFPLGVAAKGLLLLAYAPSEIQTQVLTGQLPAFTKHTTTDPAAIRELLERARAEGSVATRDDLQVGVGSVAAAVRDSAGQVAGCISLVVRSQRLDDAGFKHELVAGAQETALGVSLALGWHPHPISAA